MKVYTVIAYRWGDRNDGSYEVGCYATEPEAVAAAIHEEGERGGKYACEVLEWTVGIGLRELADNDGDDCRFTDKSVARVVRELRSE